MSNPKNKDFYKELIYEGFFPQGKFAQPHFAIAEKAVNDFIKKSATISDLIDVVLYYVETGSEFMNEFDGIDIDVCTDLEEKFEEALQKIVENNLESKFKNRCREIVKNANDGYGFSDGLEANFKVYFQSKNP